MRVRVPITIEVDVEIDEYGAVRDVCSPWSSALAQSVGATHTAVDLLAAHAHQTRQRIDDGLVRIERTGADLVFGRYVRSTATQHVLNAWGRDTKWNRRGRQPGSNGYGAWRINRDDLDALNAGTVKPGDGK